ncbi:MAG: 2-succinyl-5-enolpyruvyl-6-hydroxy-3-cyclohexene-1-carboxylic-acid synthase [Flavobacteriales bacterium]
MTSASFRVQVVVDLLKKHQVKNIVFSPGSRNAPLVIGFNSDHYFKTKVLVDERSAAFFALGMAQQLEEPVVICSTSGSAVLNYSPAIVEAFYQKIPLIVITADRPPEWVDHGEGQSMRQYKVYENFIAESYNLPMLDHPDALWQTGVMTNEAFHISKLLSKPVHLNFPFREPLYKTELNPSQTGKKITHFQTKKSLSKEELKSLQKNWVKQNKKMIVCGSVQKNSSLNEILIELNKDPSVCILTETTSNLYNENFISCIDRTLERIKDNPKFYPEIVITIGNSIISKKLKSLLRKNKPKEHWHIEEANRAQDIFSTLTHFVPIEPEDFFKDFLNNYQSNKDSNFSNNWYLEFEKSEENHLHFLSSCKWSDLKAHDLIQKQLNGKNVNLQMGNSTSVRYVQLFKQQKDLKYNSNRGVSGIDGSSSTAVGAASVTNELTVLITGDLSFIYDQHALWNKEVPKNLKIIVVNNQGGGIFNIISGPKTTPYSKEFFETTHEISLEKIAATFKINYQKANNEIQADGYLNNIFNSKDAEIIELFTGNIENENILNDYFKEIKKD